MIKSFIFSLCLLPHLRHGMACDIPNFSIIFARLLIEITGDAVNGYYIPLTFNPIPAGITDDIKDNNLLFPYIIIADIIPVTLPDAVTSIDITDISFTATCSDPAAINPGPGYLPQVECLLEDDKGISYRFTAQSEFMSSTNDVVRLLTIEYRILFS